MMQQLHGSPALAPLARRAWIGLAIAVSVTAVAYALSYFRTLRKIVEEPDIMPGGRRSGWLPRFGTAPQTAIVQFAIRTLMRSRQHRVILAFYLSIGFAMTIFLLRSPAVTERILETVVGRPATGGQHPDPGVDIDHDDRLRGGNAGAVFHADGSARQLGLPHHRRSWMARDYLAAARRSLLALSAVPLWIGSAALCFSLWPWRQAAAHVVALGLFGLLLADSVHVRLPQDSVHVLVSAGEVAGSRGDFGRASAAVLHDVRGAVRARRAVDASGQATLLGSLLAAAVLVRWRSVALAKSEATWLRFEDAPADEILMLGLAGGR